MIDFTDFERLTDVQWRSRAEAERGLYIAEGAKTIDRALRAGHRLRGVVCEERWVSALLQLGVPTEAIAVQGQDEMERLTGYHVHRGALAAFDRPAEPSLDEILTTARRLVVIEDVVDHTNVGAILRSAAAFEIDAVLLTPSCADPLYRRSIKVAMGAVFAVPWTRIPWPTGIDTLHDSGFTTLALTPEASATDIRTLDEGLRSTPLALVFGTEGDGLTSAALQRCSLRVRIPMAHNVDSLNVAAAAAVACFELTR